MSAVKRDAHGCEYCGVCKEPLCCHEDESGRLNRLIHGEHAFVEQNRDE